MKKIAFLMVCSLMAGQVYGQKLNTLPEGTVRDSVYLLGASGLGAGQTNAKVYNMAAILDYVGAAFAPALTFNGVLTTGSLANQGFFLGKVASVHPYRGFQVQMLADSSMGLVMADTGATSQISMNTDNGVATIQVQGNTGSSITGGSVNATSAVGLSDGVPVNIGHSAGTVFGDAGSKMAFYGGTPRVQQSGNLIVDLVNLGLVAAASLNTNDLTFGPVPFSVGGSTSGTADFSEPFIAPYYKKVMIRCNALLGTASWTFPTAFTNTPYVVSTTGLSVTIVTTLTQTTVTVTGTGGGASGLLTVEGY